MASHTAPDVEMFHIRSIAAETDGESIWWWVIKFNWTFKLSSVGGLQSAELQVWAVKPGMLINFQSWIRTTVFDCIDSSGMPEFAAEPSGKSGLQLIKQLFIAYIAYIYRKAISQYTLIFLSTKAQPHSRVSKWVPCCTSRGAAEYFTKKLFL